MGPIFSEYLFIRFFQRGDEETSDQRYWPVPKFQELLMQLNFYAVPDAKLIRKGKHLVLVHRFVCYKKALFSRCLAFDVFVTI